MWWAYLLTFFGGSIVGLIVMGLCAVSRETEPHEVHVYCDEDGNMKPQDSFGVRVAKMSYMILQSIARAVVVIMEVDG